MRSGLVNVMKMFIWIILLYCIMVDERGEWREGYVALIDILGFSEGILRHNLQTFFHEYNKSVHDVLSTPEAQNLEYIVFSDTIVIYTHYSNKKSFLSLVRACSLLFVSLLKIGLPLRGCISHGKFHLQKNPNGVIIAGEPIIDAHDYEQKQNWIGIMISPKVIEKIPFPQDPTIKRYFLIRRCEKIPFHENGGTGKYEGYVVVPSERIDANKDKIIEDINKTIDLLKRKKSVAPDVRSQEKYSNTIEWLKDCIVQIRGGGGSGCPDLNLIVDVTRVKKEDEIWIIPFLVENLTDTLSENCVISLEIKNPENCDEIKTIGFEDVSDVNLGKSVYQLYAPSPFYKDIKTHIGHFKIKMKANKRTLKLSAMITAKNMKHRIYDIDFHITKNKVTLKKIKDRYIS